MKRTGGTTRAVLVAVGAVALSAPAGPAAGQCVVTEDGQCNAVDGGDGEEFGWSVSLSGDAMVIGSIFANGSIGRAYVHRFDGESWNEEFQLDPSDGAAEDLFAYAIALSGDVAMIGATGDDDAAPSSGAVYVFEFNGSAWNETQKIVPSDAGYGLTFGRSIALDGATALVGCLDSLGNGAAYILDHAASSWVVTPRLTASDGAPSDWFGSAVALDSNSALVGAPQHDESAFNSGAAYIFEYNGDTWSESQKLLAIDGAENDRFGTSVSAASGIALVGAPNHAQSSGAVYVFEHDGATWTFVQKLTPNDSAPDQSFGRTIDWNGTAAIIGAVGDSANAGAAYYFEYAGNGFVEQAKLVASDGLSNDTFGWSISTDGSNAMVGAKDAGAGAVYVFPGFVQACDACPWDLDGAGGVSTSDLLAVLAAWGTDPGGPPDFDGDGIVSTSDLLESLGNWGPCP